MAKDSKHTHYEVLASDQSEEKMRQNNRDWTDYLSRQSKEDQRDPRKNTLADIAVHIEQGRADSITIGEEPSENIVNFGNGAMRDNSKPRYCDIPPECLRRLALIYAEGARKFGLDAQGNNTNWQQGLPWSNTYDHLMEHLQRYREGDRSEDHLAKVVWGCFTQMWYDDKETKAGCFADIQYQGQEAKE